MVRLKGWSSILCFLPQDSAQSTAGEHFKTLCNWCTCTSLNLLIISTWRKPYLPIIILTLCVVFFFSICLPLSHLVTLVSWKKRQTKTTTTTTTKTYIILINVWENLCGIHKKTQSICVLFYWKELLFPNFIKKIM